MFSLGRHVVQVIRGRFLLPPASVISSVIDSNYVKHTRKLSFSKMEYHTVERGKPYSTDYRVYFYDSNGPVSPFHDIPMFADKENRIFNMIVEIPRWTNAKMEIATKEPLNPIKQDVKKGMVRFVHNCFPHHGYIWNYGAIPQTWECPHNLDEATGCKGDNDPIDVIEIGYRVAKRGEVLKVKVLGVMALIDEGETDWKVVAISIQDPLADKLNDIEDVEKHMPGLLQATYEWFRIYKMPGGNPPNQFAFNGEARNRKFAENVIEETHKQWTNLIGNASEPNDLVCSTVVVDSPFKITATEAIEIVEKNPPKGEAESIDPIVDKWHYVQLT
ncbi:inorganic pyrophosphatase-like [Centruroides sculpturatus]|uniref:inorganic pyrophosphatase-like n=1 Tax=Centruroides sculpturatus TaxID=218467 RepID=UPI000C6CCAB3|nr:inorganic pyrophosphatase-like [Centruroides sculpturatus]